MAKGGGIGRLAERSSSHSVGVPADRMTRIFGLFPEPLNH